MKNKLLLYLSLAALFIASASTDIHAQKKKKKGKKVEAAAPPKKEKKGPKKIADEVKSHDQIDGLFTFYRDSVSGSVKMVITDEQLEKEFIHFYYFENGITEGRMNKGSFRGSKIFKIRKYYNKIEFVAQNSALYFDPENPLSRSAEANVSHAILFSGKIVAGSPEEKKYLIEADGLFLKDHLGVINRTAQNKDPKAFKLGNLSSSKTKYVDIRNYENNSDVIVEYVFDNKKPNPVDSDAITDTRFVTTQVQHSFIAVPDNGYTPRYDDPRVGYFLTEVTDMTTKDVIPYRDLIHRWHLVKKNPDAALSDPVEPITWWIENTTPYEFRETIKKGVLAWNKAFEKAGFTNAMAVKVQPDSAEWDAGDISYNVLRWTSSENPAFGGYGPSFVNPRTGQILGADIMLEYIHHTIRVRYDELFDLVNGFESYEKMAEEIDDPQFCIASELSQMNTLFGITAMSALDANADDIKGLQEEAMMRLIMHEVGHTLGLNHNMKGSQRFSPEELYNKEVIAGKALSTSVMEYPAINVSINPQTQGHYYDMAVGPYDAWAIQFGYGYFDSEEEMQKHLAQSAKPELVFGNDADDMRRAGKAIDPRVMIYDLSNDPITYAIDRCKIVNDLMPKLKEKYSKEGESYQALSQAFNTLSRQYSISGTVISRYVGGVYVDRTMVGQEGATQPYTPVSLADQKRAMDALSKYIFAPDAFSVPSELYNYLALQRRGFNFFSSTEDPKLHARVIRAQSGVLSHLLHYNTLQRISDSELYGNKYGLSTMMTDLNNAIFKADAYKSVNSFRQNLQLEYVKKLISILETKKGYTNMAKSMALYNLQAAKKLASNGYGNTATKAHKQHLLLLINDALDLD